MSLVREERPLRGLEQVMVQLHPTMGPDIVIGRVEGPLDVGALRAGARVVLGRHASLRARLVDGALVADGRVPDVTVEIVADDADPTDPRPAWQRLAERCTALRMGSRGDALARFYVVPGESAFHLLVAAHHCVCDGTSLYRVLHDWLAASAAPSAPVAFPLPSGALDAFPVPWWVRPILPLLRAVWRWDLRRWAHHPLLTRRALAPGEAVTSLAVFETAPAALFPVLHAACKSRDLTVGAAFLAAVHLATARRLSDPFASGELHIPLDAEVNLRSRATPPVSNEVVGFWTAGVRLDLAVGPSSTFWELAARLHGRMKTMVDRGFPALTWWVMDGVDYPASAGDLSGSGGTGSLVNASNVGPWPYPTAFADCRLTEVFGMNGACLGGPGLIAWLRCIDGRLCGNVVGSAPTWTREALATTQRDILRLLTAAAAGDPGVGWCVTDATLEVAS